MKNYRARLAEFPPDRRERIGKLAEKYKCRCSDCKHHSVNIPDSPEGPTFCFAYVPKWALDRLPEAIAKECFMPADDVGYCECFEGLHRASPPAERVRRCAQDYNINQYCPQCGKELPREDDDDDCGGRVVTEDK